MTPDACGELDAGALVRCELEALRATLHEFRDSFLDHLDAMERRMIRTMVGTMLGGILAIGLIGLIVLAVSE